MDFNFSLDNSQVSSNNSNYFKPYTINKINNIKAEYVKGTSESGKDWEALDITYSGPDGSIKKRYFIPATAEEGVKRGVFPTSNGGTNETPSSYEILKQTVVHILGIYTPTGFEKFKEYCKKVKNMKQFLDGFVKIINAAPSKETNIKVVGRNSKGTIYADLPRACGIVKDKDGHFTDETYPINFLGDNLSFTAYEEKQKSQLSEAKPTEMEDIPNVDTVKEEAPDIDFGSLL